MGVFTFESQGTSAIPPNRLFKAFVLDADNLIPMVAPHAIKSTEIIEGNGGPGTIKKITFGEGDALSDKLENISTETKLMANPDGGCIIKSTSKYQTMGDFQLMEEQIQGGKEKASGLFNAVEAYLLAHPDLYN